MKLLRLKDWPYPLVAAILTAAAIIGTWRGAGGPAYLAIGVAVSAWAIYGLLVFWRWQLISSIDFVTSDGIAVQTNGFPVTLEMMEVEAARVNVEWFKKTGLPDVRSTFKDLLVKWRKLPFEGVHGRTSGQTFHKFKITEVGFLAPLEKTSLMHELGHIICAAKGLGEYHAFAKAHDLP